MKVVDANVLLAAVNADAANHEVARGWLESALSGDEAVGFGWTVLLAFLRLSTRRDIFPAPLSVGEAAAVIERWLAARPAVVVQPTARHLAVLRGHLEPLGTGGNLVNDGHLATLAVEHGAEIVSFDTDFSRFPGLRWSPPGAGD
ncbi:MAG TPA: type II toxin-antitoxin system VapC family toxin [Actinomycetota bacterium]|nr:type II toxin-antitoxin system VapC family toxin [Actinomycetota bacterium]